MSDPPYMARTRQYWMPDDTMPQIGEPVEQEVVDAVLARLHARQLAMLHAFAHPYGTTAAPASDVLTGDKLLQTMREYAEKCDKARHVVFTSLPPVQFRFPRTRKRRIRRKWARRPENFRPNQSGFLFQDKLVLDYSQREAVWSRTLDPDKLAVYAKTCQKI